ncbi:MAG: heparinase II/III family protein, partial [Clostridiales bacterium]|nr:heparinase II/III family protein [Clostridiales bacterium]
RLSVKAAVRNHTAIPYADGTVYLDDFYIYTGDAPVESPRTLAVPGAAVTYMNKQFTADALNSRGHGAISFDSAVSVVDRPSAFNKSAAAVLGADGVYFPLETAAERDFHATVIYQADGAAEFFVKNRAGHAERLFSLNASDRFERAEIAFHFGAGKAVLTYADGGTDEAAFTLKDAAYFGFFGAGTRITINKIFAYGGAERLEDGYFKDYSYQKKAIMELTENAGWRNAYAALSKGIFLSVDFYQASVFGNKLRYTGQPPRVFHDLPYVPAEETIAFFGGEVLQNDDDGIVFTANGDTARVTAEELYTAKNTVYMTAKSLAAAFGLTLSWDGAYLMGFGKGMLFSPTEENLNLKGAVYYQRPSGEEVFDRIEKAGNLHPRVMANAERIAEIRANINTNPTIRQWYERLKQNADSYVDTYALYFVKADGVRLLTVSNTMQARMEALGIAYKMTGDTKYAEAAWRDLNAVSKFATWNPTHWLDIGSMSIGVAIGYSWFYDYLTEAQREIIVEGYRRNALKPYIDSVDSTDWWTVTPTNWNPWCHGGMMLGIIAMSDRLGDEGKYALDRMFPYLEYLYPSFIPDGAWLEGTAYHAATLRYLSMWCETMEAATNGADFGYWDLPGMDMTSYYGDALSGAGGVFNYGDNTETRANYEAQAWFAKKYRDPGLAQLRFSNMQANNTTPVFYDLIMARPEMFGEKNTMESDVYYKSLSLVSMRTSWTDSSDGIFLAAKGGENGVSHFHYDLGGFVLDVGGVRFAYELGREGYTVTQYDDETYQYKKRSEGHNTYTINPTALPGQGDTAIAEVVEFQTDQRGGYSIIDLTQAYSEARDMKRGFFLTNDRQTMILQDEVELTGASEVYWFLHTRGDIVLSEDGKTAEVTYNGVTARFDILDSDNQGAMFEVRDALPLETTPWLEGQGRNENYKKLT